MTNRKMRYKSYMQLLGKLNMHQQGNFVCNEYSDGRTTEYWKLSDEQQKEVLHHLRQLWENHPDKHQLEQMQTMRKKFYAFCYRLQWTKADGKLDYKRIDAWLLKYSVNKKKINDLNYKELTLLLNQITLTWQSIKYSEKLDEGTLQDISNIGGI